MVLPIWKSVQGIYSRLLFKFWWVIASRSRDHRHARAGAAFTQVVRHFHPRSSYMPKLGIPQKILKYALSEIESEGIFMFFSYITVKQQFLLNYCAC